MKDMFKPTISNSSRKMAARGTKDVMERLYWTKEKLEEQKAKKAKAKQKGHQTMMMMPKKKQPCLLQLWKQR